MQQTIEPKDPLFKFKLNPNAAPFIPKETLTAARVQQRPHFGDDSKKKSSSTNEPLMTCLEVLRSTRP